MQAEQLLGLRSVQAARGHDYDHDHDHRLSLNFWILGFSDKPLDSIIASRRLALLWIEHQVINWIHSPIKEGFDGKRRG